MSININNFLPDELWDIASPIIYSKIPNYNKKSPGTPRANLRNVLATIIYILCTGASWRQVDRVFGIPRSTAHEYFTEWSHNGTLDELHKSVLSKLPVNIKTACIDSQQVRAKKGAKIQEKVQ